MPVEYGLVQAPSNISAPDGSNAAILQGKAGEQIYADIHGKWYTAAYRGRVFEGTTAAAGTTIPISSATAGTFVLYNPLGSGVNMELVSYECGINTVTTVASAVLLGIAVGLVVAPTSVTALTPLPGLLGGSAVAQGKLYSVATIVATTSFYTLFGITATNATAGNSLGSPLRHEFDGKLILAPGTLVHVCGTAAQTSATAQTFVWAEWPI